MASRFERERASGVRMTHSSELSPEERKAHPALGHYHSTLERVGSTHKAMHESRARRAANENRKEAK